MITREQFEAHVRAEAEKRYDMRWNEYRHLQNAYIAARMEHEWPLVEALQNSQEVIYQMVDGPHRAAWGQQLDENDAALSPYTTNPIEP